MIRRGELRAEKIAYDNGVGCCIWRVFPGHGEGPDEQLGIAWDFEFEELDNIMAILQELKGAPAEPVG